MTVLVEYHRQEAQRIQDQLFELEHYHKDIVSRCDNYFLILPDPKKRFQVEVEYLKRQLEMTGHDHSHEAKYDTQKQRVMLPGSNAPVQPRVTAFSPNLTSSDTNRAPPLGGLPGVLSSLKNEPSVITGVVASVVGGGRGAGGMGGVGGGVGSGRGAPGNRTLPGGPLRSLPRNQAGGVIVVGSGAEGGEENFPNLVIEEQDIVMASVNPGDK